MHQDVKERMDWLNESRLLRNDLLNAKERIEALESYIEGRACKRPACVSDKCDAREGTDDYCRARILLNSGK